MAKLFTMFLGALTLAGALQGGAFADTFPNRPIRMIYPLAAGSGPDGLGRKIAVEASKVLGQPVVFENRPGANGRLGLPVMRDAPPDGHLINFLPDGVNISQPALDPDFHFEPGKDYAAVSLLWGAPLVLLANPAVPYKDLKGLIAYAKANPRKVNFAVSAGSSTQFLAERFIREAGIEVTLVPYKGSAEAGTSVLGGHSDLFLASFGQQSQVESGRLIALASSTRERWKPYPNVPTFTEAGVPLIYNVTYFVVASAATSKDTVMALHKAFDAAMRSQEVTKSLDELGLVSYSSMQPEEVASFIRSEIKVWTPILRKPAAKAQ